MIARMFAIPSGLVVLVLVGAAMFHSDGAPKTSNNASAIRAGETAPHGDRGLCTACHLLGGPGKNDMNAAGANKSAAQSANAPSIRIDQIRPHAERGSCVNCHTILPATQLTAAADQLMQMGPVSMAAPGYVPSQGYAPTQMGQGYAPWPNQAPPAVWGSAQIPRSTRTPASPPGNPSRGAVRQPPPGGGTVAPPIVQGTPAPHGWRGQCVGCHSVSMASPTPTWSPTPPLGGLQATATRLAQRGPRETEALGMAVRPTAGDTPGMMVVEVEGMARKAGLKLGDVVRAMDGQLTTDISSFVQASRGADPRLGVVIDVVRDGQAQALILR